MIIALDFDDTFTAMPEVFTSMILAARKSGHAVYIVTARRDTDSNYEDINSLLFEHKCDDVPVFFTALGSKITYMEKLGIKVDIWIDDNPTALVHGH